jgi:outer membrane protein
MKNIKKIALYTALVAASAVAVPVKAEFTTQAGDIMVRGRVLDVVPTESADISIGGDVDINNHIVPEVDFSYFFTSNIAVEVIAAITPHDVGAHGTALGNLDLGSVWLLPPTVTAQYHFNTNTPFKPYLGAGVNYTHFFGADEGSSIASIDYDNSFGPALQAGLDYAIDDHWVVNVDVKKIWINSDVKVNGGAVTADVDINPLVIGVGVGYKF